MDLDTILAEAAPARRERFDGPDSPAAVSLYQRITATRPAAAPMRRRVVLSVTGATATLAAVAVALTLVSGSPATVPRDRADAQQAMLAAWTTAQLPHGLVQVTIRQLRDPEGLARALAADGIPANVQFITHQLPGNTGEGQMPSSCRAPRMSDAASGNLQGQIFPEVTAGTLEPGSFKQGNSGSYTYGVTQGTGSLVVLEPTASGSIKIFTVRYPGADPNAALYIESTAIPRGIGIYIAAWAAPPGTDNGMTDELQTGLVAASPQCTGS